METTRREMIIAGAAIAGLTVLPPVVRAGIMPADKVKMARTVVTLHVPHDVLGTIGLPPTTEALDRELVRVATDPWLSKVRFDIMDVRQADMYQDGRLQWVRDMVPYPGVTRPQTPIAAVGKRIVKFDSDIEDRSIRVEYEVWAGPVTVTSMHVGNIKVDEPAIKRIPYGIDMYYGWHVIDADDVVPGHETAWAR